MSLKDLQLKISYGPGDNRLGEFFIPALSESVRYERAAGYFSSSMLAVAASGVSRLIGNGGKMRLLCGADLSEDDVQAIQQGEELAARITHAMKKRLFMPEDKIAADRLRAMAWMVATGQLEIKVVLPTDKDGRPLPANKTESYYHPKEGVFTDAEGNQVGFSGSVNESATALEDNYESFMVFNSWDTSPAHLGQIRIKFDRLWEGKEKDWLAMPIPEAVRQELLKYRPSAPPLRDPLEKIIAEPEDKEEPVVKIDADQRERIIFQFLRDAPHLPNAYRLGVETCTVKPWPHQVRVIDTVVSRFPERFMLCDEVGLGKTIEAGAAIRQLVLSGRATRVLILVPHSVLVQWQEELYEKFVMSVPRYDGHTFRDVFGRELKAPKSANPWDVHPILLASSQLAKRVERQEQLAEAQDWDLLVVDEAHHARRKDFLNRQQFRPNRLMELLNGTAGRQGLKDRTKGLLLLTATPMQVDPLEVWDLLKVLGMGGRWGAGEDNFLTYYREIQKPVDDVDWDFVLGMLADHFDSGGQWDENFCKVCQARVGPAEWDQISNLPHAANPMPIIRRLSPAGQAVLREVVRRHTPLRRYVFRSTRELLRTYREKGFLKENVPHRDPKPVWIDMTEEELKLYHRIEEYIREHYQKYEAERRGLGFIMTVYRRRLTSSFYAIQRSLERRLEYLTGIAGKDHVSGLTDDDLEQEDLSEDVSEQLQALAGDPEARKLFTHEIHYVENFLAELKSLGSDSKFEQLARDLRDILNKRDSVIVFTQYADTMDYLRDKLQPVYGSQVACYSGRGGERWDGRKWVGTSKENIKIAFKEKQEIKILLCTEAASEGINLQTCGVLVNSDMPWNPMRVEQRIGRIDRIGQLHDRVWVLNYFYNGTVEADVYHRLDDRIGSFESVVGELQPILTRVARTIEAAAMAGDERRGQIIATEVAAINQQVRSAEVSSLNLDNYVDDSVSSSSEAPPPVTLAQLERTIIGSASLGHRLKPHPRIAGAHLFDWRGDFQEVTFNPGVFDEHPNSVQFLSFGSPLLTDVLTAVSEPSTSHDSGILARCESVLPCNIVGYFRHGEGGLERVASLDGIERALDPTKRSYIDTGEAALVPAAHATTVGYFLDHELSVVRNRHHSYLSSLTEEVRQLLLQGTYIELAMAADRGLFDEAAPVDFSEDAMARLARHKYPFAGALKLVSIAGLRPRRDDPYFVRISQCNRDALLRRFESARSKIADTLERIVLAKRVQIADPIPQESRAIATTVRFLTDRV